jgi:hypothetical protein
VERGELRGALASTSPRRWEAAERAEAAPQSMSSSSRTNAAPSGTTGGRCCCKALKASETVPWLTSADPGSGTTAAETRADPPRRGGVMQMDTASLTGKSGEGAHDSKGVRRSSAAAAASAARAPGLQPRCDCDPLLRLLDPPPDDASTRVAVSWDCDPLLRLLDPPPDDASTRVTVIALGPAPSSAVSRAVRADSLNDARIGTVPTRCVCRSCCCCAGSAKQSAPLKARLRVVAERRGSIVAPALGR